MCNSYFTNNSHTQAMQPMQLILRFDRLMRTTSKLNRAEDARVIELGKFVRRLRVRSKMSWIDLANRMQIDIDKIMLLEAGRVPFQYIDLDIICKLSKHLHCRVSEICTILGIDTPSWIKRNIFRILQPVWCCLLDCRQFMISGLWIPDQTISFVNHDVRWGFLPVNQKLALVRVDIYHHVLALFAILSLIVGILSLHGIRKPIDQQPSSSGGGTALRSQGMK